MDALILVIAILLALAFVIGSFVTLLPLYNRVYDALLAPPPVRIED
jgi:hypothetical protein